MSMRDLLEARGRTVAAMREITEHPEDNGDLSDEQARKFDTLKDELAKIEQRIQRQAIIDEADRRMAGVQLTEGSGDDRFDAQCRGFSLQRAIASQIEPRAVDAGRELEVSQELARRSGKSPRGMLVPLTALVERRVTLMDPASSPQGGAVNLLGTDHRADLFVDALRAATVTGQLGVRTLTGLRENIAIPKYGTGPAAEWVAENEALTGGDYTFEQLTAEPHHVGILTEWSRRVMLQANPAIEQLVRADFTAKLALAVDLAVLKGSGVGAEPQGITNSGAQTVTESGTGSWANILKLVALVESQDVPMTSLGWAANAWVAAEIGATLMTPSDTNSNFIMGRDRTIAGYPVKVTSQLAGGPAGSPNIPGELIFGDWAQAMVLFWGDAGADILVNPYESTAYKKGNVLIRGFVDADVVVRHPAAFVHVSGIDLSD